jgi:hypothetical protein
VRFSTTGVQKHHTHFLGKIHVKNFWPKKLRKKKHVFPVVFSHRFVFIAFLTASLHEEPKNTIQIFSKIRSESLKNLKKGREVGTYIAVFFFFGAPWVRAGAVLLLRFYFHWHWDLKWRISRIWSWRVVITAFAYRYLVNWRARLPFIWSWMGAAGGASGGAQCHQTGADDRQDAHLIRVPARAPAGLAPLLTAREHAQVVPVLPCALHI